MPSKRTTISAKQTKDTGMWHVRINRAAMPDDTVGTVSVYGINGVERRLLKSTQIVGGLSRDRDELPDPFTVIEGAWPRTGDERLGTEVIHSADEVEVDLDFDQDFNVNATVTADAQTGRAGNGPVVKVGKA